MIIAIQYTHAVLEAFPRGVFWVIIYTYQTLGTNRRIQSFYQTQKEASLLMNRIPHERNTNTARVWFLSQPFSFLPALVLSLSLLSNFEQFLFYLP